MMMGHTGLMIHKLWIHKKPTTTNEQKKRTKAFQCVNLNDDDLTLQAYQYSFSISKQNQKKMFKDLLQSKLERA